MLQSHTATQQWQSFEMRMRQRRVERCLLRASVAIEAGVLDDARQALDEVRQLAPDEPSLEFLAAQLAAAQNPPPVTPIAQPPPPASRGAGHHRFAAVTVLLTGSVVAGWGASSFLPRPSASLPPRSAPQSAPQSVTPAPSPPVPSVRVSEMSVAAPVSQEPVPPADAPIATSGSPLASNDRSGAEVPTPAINSSAAPASATRLETREAAQEPRAAAAGEPRGSALPQAGETRDPRLGFAGSGGNAPARSLPNDISPVVPPPAPSPKIEPLGGLPVTADAPPPVVAGAEGITAPDATPRAAAALPAAPSAPPPNPAPAAHSEEQGVRATLSRYESAYNRLDAAGAASVWPGVNQRALASAFQGLSAQSISLGRCDVRVSGATAHAECSGTARWTPKVGGGTQGGARQWRFDLRNSGGDWVIAQAIAR